MRPRWPAVIQYAGEVKLTVVSDQQEWDCDADLSCWPYKPDDALVDSNGHVFMLSYAGRPGGGRVVTLEATGRQAEASEVSQAVRDHLRATEQSSEAYERWCDGASAAERVARSIEYLNREQR